MNPTQAAIEALAFAQTFPAKLLVAVTRGVIDMNEIVRLELVSRGLNTDGVWIGFDQAQSEYAREVADSLKADG